MKASDINIANDLLGDVARIDQQLEALKQGNLNGAELTFGVSPACGCPDPMEMIFGNVPGLEFSFNHNSDIWPEVQLLAERMLETQRKEILQLLKDMGVVTDA